MILLISLVLVEVFLLLCAKPMKKHPGAFYAAAALASAVVTGLYWVAPEGISPALLSKFPLWIGALGTACFIAVMTVGAMPNGHARMKQVMPIRGELSIFACLLTLGQNLSYGKNYLTPGYLLSGPMSATKAAAWVSVVMILLMLVLTVTSIKAVRRKFSPKGWKALQRWAYLFYGLIYVHVLLMNVPGFLKGRSGCGLTVLMYSLVFLSYALCRVRKAVFMKRGQAAKVAGRGQLVTLGVGVVLSVLLVGGLHLSVPGTSEVPTPSQTPEPLSQGTEEPDLQPEEQEAGDAPVDDAEEAPTEQEGPEKDSSEAPEEQESSEEDHVETPVETPEDEAEDELETDNASEPEPEQKDETDTAVESGETEDPASQTETESEQAPEPEPEPEQEPEPTYKYREGTYTGSGEGYYGTVTVSVTISEDVITNISISSYIDDDDYFGDAWDGVVPAILSAQSPDVSAVSGATYSSKGIMAAVRDALAQAEN